MAGRVSGKIALVTGGASGIGKACAARLAAEGAIVVITDIDDELGQTTTKEICEAGGSAEYLHHDVTSETEWEAVINHLRDGSGGLDILVNNAGIGIGGSLLDMSLDDWRRQQAINLDGVFLGLKHGIALMKKTGGGSVINMSSVAGLQGSSNLAGYCATKGGVRLLTKGVALECAQQGW
ncbi:MAG: SDR family NAD(P)-dependent oxidoreductase, partial [Pseudomonadales bacterium]